MKIYIPLYDFLANLHSAGKPLGIAFDNREEAELFGKTLEDARANRKSYRGMFEGILEVELITSSKQYKEHLDKHSGE